MHVAQFKAHVLARAEDVHAQRRLVGEVHGIGSGRNVVVGEQSSAAELEIRGNPSVALEVPLQAKRVESCAVGGICRLKDQKDGNRIDGIFEAPAEKAGKVFAGDHPAETKAGVEGAGVAASSSDGVAAARPKFDLVAALFGRGLRQTERRRNQQQ